MVVRRAFEALADGGVEAMLEFVHPEGAMTTPPEFASEPDTYSGHDGLRRYFESFYEVMDRVDVEVHELDEVGPAEAIASLELRARGRTTGIELGQRVEALCRVREGKLWRIEFFPTREDALAAAASD